MHIFVFTSISPRYLFAALQMNKIIKRLRDTIMILTLFPTGVDIEWVQTITTVGNILQQVQVVQLNAYFSYVFAYLHLFLHIYMCLLCICIFAYFSCIFAYMHNLRAYLRVCKRKKYMQMCTKNRQVCCTKNGKNICIFFVHICVFHVL